MLFNEWYYSGETLVAVEVKFQKRQTLRRLMQTKWGWRTHGDLMQQYHNDAKAVSQLIAAKVERKLWRPHPELPAVASQIQYYVRIDEGTEEGQGG